MVVTNINSFSCFRRFNCVVSRIGNCTVYIRNFLNLMSEYIKRSFEKKNGIFSFPIKDIETKKVTEFYKVTPFPNYKDDDNKQSILEKGNRNILAQKFKNFIGYKKKVLEVGCGTGQLSIYFSLQRCQQKLLK